MKATEQYFAVVLFIMLYKVVLTLKSVDEILKRDQPNESYWAVHSCGTLYYAVQGGLTFESLGEILKCAMQLKATEQYFPLVFLMVVQKVVLIFWYAASCRSLRNGKPVRRSLFLQCVYHILFTLMSKCSITLIRGPQRFIVICTVHCVCHFKGILWVLDH